MSWSTKAGPKKSCSYPRWTLQIKLSMNSHPQHPSLRAYLANSVRIRVSTARVTKSRSIANLTVIPGPLCLGPRDLA